MLAERVGGTGSVLAVDLDTSLLAPLAIDRIEVRRHDLCGDLRAIGLVDVQADYAASCDPEGSLGARLLSLTFERLREQMVAFGAENEDIDEARRLLEDPRSTFSSPTTCVARARRPAG